MSQAKVVCKGSWALGTACGRCFRCVETAPAEVARLRQVAKDAEADADMYAKAWQRELGPWMGPKRHHIDACVVGTQRLRAAVAWTEGLKRWKADATLARTLGMPEPSLIDYLPKTADPRP